MDFESFLLVDVHECSKFLVDCSLFIHMCIHIYNYIHMLFLDLCLLFMIDCSCVLLICMNVQRCS